MKEMLASNGTLENLQTDLQLCITENPKNPVRLTRTGQRLTLHLGEEPLKALVHLQKFNNGLFDCVIHDFTTHGISTNARTLTASYDLLAAGLAKLIREQTPGVVFVSRDIAYAIEN